MTDKEFNLVSKVDKHGRRVNKKDNALKEYYQIEDEGKKYYDEDGKFAWDQDSSSDEQASELSESSGDAKIQPVPR